MRDLLISLCVISMFAVLGVFGLVGCNGDDGGNGDQGYPDGCPQGETYLMTKQCVTYWRAPETPEEIACDEPVEVATQCYFMVAVDPETYKEYQMGEVIPSEVLVNPDFVPFVSSEHLR